MRNRIISGFVLIVFLGVFVISPVKAGNEGSGDGHGGQQGCGLSGWTLDTCYGATWRYYKTDSDSVTILGNYSNGGYAHSTTITGCKAAGGYWRYAMVAYGSGTLSDHSSSYSAGDQVGVVGISGNSDSTFDTTFWGGGMNYIGTRADFDKVGELYREAQKKYPSTFTLGYASGSNLAWFCADDPTEPTYYASSQVSNRKDSVANNEPNNYSSTGIVDGARTTETSSTMCVNDPLNMTFSHNAYATSSKEGVGWEVKRYATVNGTSINGLASSNNYTITMPAATVNSWNSTGASKTGTANITQDRGNVTPKYIAKGTGSGTSRTKTDGSNWYVSRDFYTVRFKKTGTYKLCETFYLNGKGIKTACSNVTVNDCTIPPPPDDECTEWTPSSYTSTTNNNGTSSVVSKVKNTTLGTDWSDSVYAKPTDQSNWIHCYYPGAQFVANAQATGIGTITAGTGLHGEHDNDLDSGETTSNGYDSLINLSSNWSNYLKITSTYFRNPDPNLSSYDHGDYGIKKMFDEYSVEKGKAGKSLRETGSTSNPARAYVNNGGTHSWKCDWGESCSSCGQEPCVEEDEEGNCITPGACKSCYRSYCHHSNEYLAGYAGGSASDYALVKVPYNFINTASIKLKDNTVFAGEKSTIDSLTVNVLQRNNSTTQGTYATNANGVKIKVISYLSTSNTGSAMNDVGSGKNYDICSLLSGYEACNEVGSRDNITLNSSGKMEGSTDSVTPTAGKTFNVYDASAGKYYCVVLAVYPASSGSDTMMDTSGSNSWYVSAPSCAVIAKKPSMQVWGSGLYTANKIVVNNAKKYVVNDKLNDFSGTASSHVVFGTWVEENIVASGLVNITSGASAGLAGSTVKTYDGLNGYYNSANNNNTFCIMSPLTMPNNKCSNASSTGGSSNSMSAPVDKAALISRFTEGDGDGKYELHSGVCSLSAAPSFDTIKTHVYKCEDNNGFTINNNIEVLTGSYGSLVDIPKVIIYAKSIKISCSVSRVDAVLIADETVNTCSEFSDLTQPNSQTRSNRLRINGTIIANKLIAGRTYGAATGTNSGEPAEILDYDTSLYLWGSPRADVTGSGKLESVYLTELAPRY